MVQKETDTEENGWVILKSRPDFGGNSGGGGKKLGELQQHIPHGKLGLRTGQSQQYVT
jgi:hypothetical protein